MNTRTSVTPANYQNEVTIWNLRTRWIKNTVNPKVMKNIHDKNFAHYICKRCGKLLFMIICHFLTHFKISKLNEKN